MSTFTRRMSSNSIQVISSVGGRRDIYTWHLVRDTDKVKQETHCSLFHGNISCLLTFHSWSWVYRAHMPHFGAFEVCVEHVCCFPWCPSTHWSFCRKEAWPKVSPTWLRGGRWTGHVMSAPGGHRLNNASCPALATAGELLWSVPETSVAWVFNHLACATLLAINLPPHFLTAFIPLSV